ncbi:hypothetical protein [Alteromonas sp. CYL-A6]|uniref:hypothetical protein n=1 Tax=Alteromonas nitratireducens TaxID=3390813 RepID=UPI0034B2B539
MRRFFISLQKNSCFPLGGEKLPVTPLLKWNFLAYSEEKLREAEARWRQGNFPSIPGDDAEFIPLP